MRAKLSKGFLRFYRFYLECCDYERGSCWGLLSSQDSSSLFNFSSLLVEGSFVLSSQTLKEYVAPLDFIVLALISEHSESFVYKSHHWRLQNSKVHAFQKDPKRKLFLV